MLLEEIFVQLLSLQKKFSSRRSQLVSKSLFSRTRHWSRWSLRAQDLGPLCQKALHPHHVPGPRDGFFTSLDYCFQTSWTLVNQHFYAFFHLMCRILTQLWKLFGSPRLRWIQLTRKSMKFATSDKINRSEGFISAVSGPSSHRNLATPLKKSVHGVRIPLISNAAKKGKSNQL